MADTDKLHDVTFTAMVIEWSICFLVCFINFIYYYVNKTNDQGPTANDQLPFHDKTEHQRSSSGLKECLSRLYKRLYSGAYSYQLLFSVHLNSLHTCHTMINQDMHLITPRMKGNLGTIMLLDFSGAATYFLLSSIYKIKSFVAETRTTNLIGTILFYAPNLKDHSLYLQICDWHQNVINITYYITVVSKDFLLFLKKDLAC